MRSLITLNPSSRGVGRLALLALLLAFMPLHSAQAQKRDHLTEQEADLVREMQVLDKRIEVFIRAADRRLLVLSNPAAKQSKRDEERWGPLPQGTRLELLTDYKRILEEAEEKLNDAYERQDELVPKALAKFKEAALRHLAQLRALAPQVSDKGEQRALAEAIEEAETVTKGSMSK